MNSLTEVNWVCSWYYYWWCTVSRWYLCWAWSANMHTPGGRWPNYTNNPIWTEWSSSCR